ALSADDLLIAVLENTPAARLDFEHFLTLARRALLVEVVQSLSPDKADPSLLRFSCAIARQCYINEYVYHCTTDESDGVSRLREAIIQYLTESRSVPGAWVAAVACYSPLSSLPDCQRLAGGMTEPPLRGLFTQQVKEPAQEDNYRATLTRLTPT